MSMSLRRWSWLPLWTPIVLAAAHQGLYKTALKEQRAHLAAKSSSESEGPKDQRANSSPVSKGFKVLQSTEIKAISREQRAHQRAQRAKNKGRRTRQGRPKQKRFDSEVVLDSQANSPRLATVGNLSVPTLLGNESVGRNPSNSSRYVEIDTNGPIDTLSEHSVAHSDPGHHATSPSGWSDTLRPEAKNPRADRQSSYLVSLYLLGERVGLKTLQDYSGLGFVMAIVFVGGIVAVAGYTIYRFEDTASRARSGHLAADSV